MEGRKRATRDVFTGLQLMQKLRLKKQDREIDRLRLGGSAEAIERGKRLHESWEEARSAVEPINRREKVQATWWCCMSGLRVARMSHQSSSQ
jgi:hypothetical protein